MRGVSPWYNHTGWLGVKHQLTYLLLYCSYSPCFMGVEEREGFCAAATVPVVCVKGCGREGKFLCCSYSPCCVVCVCMWKGAEERESSCAAATVPVVWCVCVCGRVRKRGKVPVLQLQSLLCGVCVYVEGCGREGEFLCCSYSPCCVVCVCMWKGAEERESACAAATVPVVWCVCVCGRVWKRGRVPVLQLQSPLCDVCVCVCGRVRKRGKVPVLQLQSLLCDVCVCGRVRKRGKVPVLQLQSLLCGVCVCMWKGAEERESSCAAATVPVVWCVCVCMWKGAEERESSCAAATVPVVWCVCMWKGAEERESSCAAATVPVVWCFREEAAAHHAWSSFPTSKQP